MIETGNLCHSTVYLAFGLKYRIAIYDLRRDIFIFLDDGLKTATHVDNRGILHVIRSVDLYDGDIDIENDLLEYLEKTNRSYQEWLR